MKKGIFVLFACWCVSIIGYSQSIVLKNNVLYDLTTTPNLALEIGLGKKTTLDLYGGLNPFQFNDNKKFKHWLFQPELRFWTCERFVGTFWGIHTHAGQYNVGGIDLPFNVFSSLKDYRYSGYFYGAGLSFGHQWVLSKDWNLEASLGGGFTRFEYDKFKCQKCGQKEKTSTQNYWGVTKATLSLIYVIQ